MEVDSSGNPNWLFDYEVMTDITCAASVAVADFQCPATIDFTWPAQTIYASSDFMWSALPPFFFFLEFYGLIK